MSAPAASSGSTTSAHRFPWKWWLRDLASVPKNGMNVFSCFACGGGSSMGYKLAGFTVLGNCEIDPAVAETYKANNHPKHSFIMDVREFLQLPDEKIPDELFHLDILDGSPPCSVFSTVGEREEGWSKAKRFAEGQKLQRLDDLFFTFIAIAKRLQPRVVVAENVSGLVKGNARGYVNEIRKAFDEAGYEIQIFLLNAASMGVPQKRERVFFIARRKDLGLPKVKLDFHEPPILFRDVRSEHGIPIDPASKTAERLRLRIPSDKGVDDIIQRTEGRSSNFSLKIVHDNDVCFTQTTTRILRDCDASYLTDDDVRNCASFPQDYVFATKEPLFFCGMSVPPVMMANIAYEIAHQIFGVK